MRWQSRTSGDQRRIARTPRTSPKTWSADLFNACLGLASCNPRQCARSTGFQFVPRYDFGTTPVLDRVLVPVGAESLSKRQVLATWSADQTGQVDLSPERNSCGRDCRTASSSSHGQSIGVRVAALQLGRYECASSVSRQAVTRSTVRAPRQCASSGWRVCARGVCASSPSARSRQRSARMESRYPGGSRTYPGCAE